jgi:hypothetical protein
LKRLVDNPEQPEQVDEEERQEADSHKRLRNAAEICDRHTPRMIVTRLTIMA